MPADIMTWTFEAGDRVPEWFMTQTNCVLTFDRDAVIVEAAGGYELYPITPMAGDDPIIIAHVINRGLDMEVDHVRPITAHLTPRAQSLN